MPKLSAWRWPREYLYSKVRNETEPRSRRSAIVFAPHQDDETLGCGGTILLKRRAGARVVCAFMTDGSTSHRQFMDEDELRRVRLDEALAATRELGVPREDVHFMAFPDGRLGQSRQAAIDAALALIVEYSPDEVYVPFRDDGLPDHEETYSVVVDACRRSGLSLEVCEYPIWAWNQWPWVPVRLGVNRESLRIVSRAVRAVLGGSLLRACRTGICIREVVNGKRNALAHYRSQVTAPPEHTGWPTLGDVSDGGFVDSFFGDFEVFRCTTIQPR